MVNDGFLIYLLISLERSSNRKCGTSSSTFRMEKRSATLNYRGAWGIRKLPGQRRRPTGRIIFVSSFPVTGLSDQTGNLWAMVVGFGEKDAYLNWKTK